MRFDFDGWTGAQFSLARAVLACSIASTTGGMLVSLAALLFGAGLDTRVSGAALALLSLARASERGWDGGLLLAGLFTALFAAAHPAPWGALMRRGSIDPGTDWRLPKWISLAMVGSAAVILIADLWRARFPLHPAHVLLLGPGWIPARGSAKRDRVFYDGSCALCHGTVRFLIAEDRHGERFRFAPLQGEHGRALLAAQPAGELPDSIVVVTADQRVLVRSAALLHLLERIGGWWRALAWLGRGIPEGLRDAAYDGVARLRYRLFGRKEMLCPLVPEGLLPRFDF